IRKITKTTDTVSAAITSSIEFLLCMHVVGRRNACPLLTPSGGREISPPYVLRLLPGGESFFELAPSGRGKSQRPLPSIGRFIGPDPAIALEACSTAGQRRVLETERFGERPDRLRAPDRQPDQ